MSSVYDVFVRLSMVNGVSPVLAILGKEFLGLKGSAESLSKSFNSMGAAAQAALGGAAIAAGAGLATVLGVVANKGDELLDQQDKLIRAGVQMNDVLAQQSRYYEKVAKAVPTSTVSSYLKTFNEMRSVVGADRAETVAPWALKLEALIGNATGKSAEGEGFKIWRALEMTGKTISNPALIDKLANAFAQDIIGSAGKLDASAFQSMAKRGGASWAAAKPEFLSGPMAVIASDMGGESAGTAMMSAYMFLTGANTMSKQQYETMRKLGLIDPNKVTTDKGGRINVGPGGIVGSSKYGSMGNFDLFNWQQEFLNPALAHASKDDVALVNDYISKIGRNRNVIRMLTMFNDPSFLEQIDKDRTLWSQAKGVDAAYDSLVTNDPKGVKAAFKDQFHSMMESIGAPMMQAALPVMKEITSLFTNIGKFANTNPGAIKYLAEGIAGLAGALIIGGSVAVVLAASAFAAGAAIPVAVTAIAGFFGTLAALNWDAVKAGLESVVNAFQWFIDKISGIAASIGSALGIGGVPGQAHSGTEGAPGHPAQGPWQPPSAGRGVPNVARPQKQSMIINQNHFYVDGHEVAMATESRLVGQGTFSTRAPGLDNYSMFQTG